MEEQLEYKIAPTEFKAAGDTGEYEGHFSVFGNVDNGFDIAQPGMFLKTIAERRQRIKVFYAHDWMKLIGPPPTVLQEDALGLFAKGRLTLDSFWGKETWALMRDGALTEGSFGFEAVKFDFEDIAGRMVRNLREVKLYEISPVPLGMNDFTQVRAVKSLLLRQMRATIPAKETTPADAGAEWDAAVAVKDLKGAAQLRAAHAWFNPDGDPDDPAAYKLAHHLADGHVVLKAVEAAGAALMAGAGIPEHDVPAVQQHLAAHYKQFNCLPPWEKGAALDTYLPVLLHLTNEIKAGRVLSSANKDRINDAVGALQAALDALNELLEAAEPEKGLSPAHSALLIKRLRAAEVALAL